MSHLGGKRRNSVPRRPQQGLESRPLAFGRVAGRSLNADREALDARRALIDLHRQQGRLDALIRRWRRRFDTRPTDASR
jgi:hypothetical protein